MTTEPRVLVIESDPAIGNELKAVLGFINYAPILVDRHTEWRDRLDGAEDILAVLVGSAGSDQKLSLLLNEIHQFNEQLPIYLLSRKGSEPTVAIDPGSCILGRLDLPPNYAQLTSALHQAEVFVETHRATTASQRPVGLFRSLVGSSRAVQNVRKLIEQVADSDANVLILGESGTGKEVVARNLHYFSSRREKPFVPVNCGAIPGDLLESELFGHQKGAFTGAISDREGRFEMAEGGTLFLDEIGDMSLQMQVKILRVLQERTFERVGSNQSRNTDVRIIAATHRNLEQAITEGEFREDLYYRLNVFPIEMPSLADRAEDIPLLVNELVRRIEHEKRGSVRLSPGAIYALCQYHWPGNVRELANLIERLAILHPYGVVDAGDLPEKFRAGVSDDVPEQYLDALVGSQVTSADLDPRLPRDGMNLKEHLSGLEINYIKQALADTGGVVAHAAKRLGMRRTTLVEKLRKYGMQRNA
ncbi:MAG: sigma-54 dependent transcriptional regulator [Gammaproteobacteria bacterium]|nr:sigma-54 dependent transcriptional regulator [Gammaproteobacteria bacterium]